MKTNNKAENYEKSYDVTFLYTLYNKDFEVEPLIYNINKLMSKYSYSFQILLCNDGSTDSTEDKCHNISQSYSHVYYIGYKKNIGRGNALKYSIDYCLGKKIIYMDSDIYKTTDLNILIKMIEMLENNLSIIATRYHKKSKTKRKILRAIVGRGYKLLVAVFFPSLKYSDCALGFKGFKTEIFKQYAFLCLEKHWAFDIEILWLLHKDNIIAKEVPIEWNECHENYHSSVKIIYDSFSQLIGFIRIIINHNK